MPQLQLLHFARALSLSLYLILAWGLVASAAVSANPLFQNPLIWIGSPSPAPAPVDDFVPLSDIPVFSSRPMMGWFNPMDYTPQLFQLEFNARSTLLTLLQQEGVSLDAVETDLLLRGNQSQLANVLTVAFSSILASVEAKGLTPSATQAEYVGIVSGLMTGIASDEQLLVVVASAAVTVNPTTAQDVQSAGINALTAALPWSYAIYAFELQQAVRLAVINAESQSDTQDQRVVVNEPEPPSDASPN